MSEEKNIDEYTCTRITPSMIVNGSIDSSDNILVEGPVYGDINTSQNVTLKNVLVGDLKADNAALDSAKLKGNINLLGTIAADKNSVIAGNLKSKGLKLEGKVRGNMEIEESALLTETALLVGDISARYVTAQTGARIFGNITIAGPNLSTNFDEEFDIPDFNVDTQNGGSF